jgi:redox-sensitive bicupin YhaK (pirin superfamily)
MERSVTAIETAAQPQRGAPTHANRFVLQPQAFDRHSPFLMLMEDWFAPPAGFPDHPHRGMETVTLVLEGAMEHRDHTGAHGMIGPGDVQWMTAGKGVVHSEMPGPNGVHSLQLWLNLPSGQKMAQARYLDQPLAKAPAVAGPGYEVRVYAGRQGEVVQDHGSSYPMGLATVTAEAGAEVRLEIPAEDRGFLYVVEGSARIGGQAVRAGQSAWFDPSRVETVVVQAVEPLKAVLYSGRPIPEPVVAYGPFVMNSMDEIRQAYADYQSGAFV